MDFDHQVILLDTSPIAGSFGNLFNTAEEKFVEKRELTLVTFCQRTAFNTLHSLGCLLYCADALSVRGSFVETRLAASPGSERDRR